jgi:hypothetical protein
MATEARAHRAWLIRPLTGDDYLGVVMPMRI